MTSEGITDSVPGPAIAKGRRFGVYDSMILIGGIALLLAFVSRHLLGLAQQALGLFHALSAYFGFAPSAPYGPPQFLLHAIASHWGSVLWYIVQVSQRLVLIATPVFLIIRVRGPRPSVGALLRQPGTIAGLAVVMGLWVTGWLYFFRFGRINDGTATAIAVGGTVFLAWAGLALSRRWETEPSWIDRMGRLIGATAILVGAFAFAVFGL